MKQAIETVYENGMFKPVHPEQVHLSDGRRVTLIVDDSCLPEPLRLVASVYAGLSAQEIDEIEKIALDRGRFFD